MAQTFPTRGSARLLLGGLLTAAGTLLLPITTAAADQHEDHAGHVGHEDGTDSTTTGGTGGSTGGTTTGSTGGDSGDTGTAPRGGVETGAGGAADPAFPAPVLLGALALTGAAGLTVATRTARERR